MNYLYCQEDEGKWVVTDPRTLRCRRFTLSCIEDPDEDADEDEIANNRTPEVDWLQVGEDGSLYSGSFYLDEALSSRRGNELLNELRTKHPSDYADGKNIPIYPIADMIVESEVNSGRRPSRTFEKYEGSVISFGENRPESQSRQSRTFETRDDVVRYIGYTTGLDVTPYLSSDVSFRDICTAIDNGWYNWHDYKLGMDMFKRDAAIAFSSDCDEFEVDMLLLGCKNAMVMFNRNVTIACSDRDNLDNHNAFDEYVLRCYQTSAVCQQKPDLWKQNQDWTDWWLTPSQFIRESITKALVMALHYTSQCVALARIGKDWH